jgi:proline dehydrogenase
VLRARGVGLLSLRRRARFWLATSGAFDRAVKGLPSVEARAWRSARRYVAGPTVADAVAASGRLAAIGLRASVDLFGERTSAEEAGTVAADYEQLCETLSAATAPSTWLSLDLSHIAFDGTLLERIARAVPPGRRLQVGAEEAAQADRILGLVEAAAQQGLPVEATLQANLRRSPRDAERLAAAGVPVRLVKGAYVESPADALPWGPPTDDAYAALARQLTNAGVDVALATHDAPLRARLLAELPNARCELLLGILPDDAVALAAAGRDTRVYVPYGPDWLRYFLRRRAESQGA